MALTNIIRTGIAIADGITKSLQPDVTHFAWVSQDARGVPEYAAPAVYPALVELSRNRVVGADGQVLFTRYSVTFLQPLPANGAEGRQEPIDPRDKLVLPNGEKVDVIDIKGFIDADTGAPFMSEVGTS